jgi:trigger factor
VVDEKENAALEAAADSDAEKQESVLDEATERVRAQREEKVPHQVTDEKSMPGSRRQLTVEVPREEWEQRVQTLFKEIQHNATIEGFRKGKAPVALLQRRYRAEVQNDVIGKIVPLIIREYEQEKNLTLYGTPTVTEFQAEETAKPVTITIEVEVKPEIVAQNYTGLEIEVPETKLSADSVDKRVEELRETNATYEAADREAKSGDSVVVDMKVVDSKGKTVQSHANELIALDSLPEPIAKEITGKKAGDSIEAKAPGERNETWRYSISLKSVKELKLPTVDDEFAKDLGYESIADMRAKIQEQYEKTLKRINEDEAFDVLMTKLIEAHEFEIPEALKIATQRSMLDSDLNFMRNTGRAPSRFKNRTRDEYYSELEKNAEERVRAYLLIDAVGKVEKLETADEDINAMLEERATEEGRKPAAIRAALERHREWDQFLEQVRFNKIRSYLLSKTKITYVEPKPEETAEEEKTSEEPKKQESAQK